LTYKAAAAPGYTVVEQWALVVHYHLKRLHCDFEITEDNKIEQLESPGKSITLQNQ